MKVPELKQWKIYTFRVAAGENSYNIKFAAPSKPSALAMNEMFFAAEGAKFSKEESAFLLSNQLPSALWADTLEMLSTSLGAPGATLLGAIVEAVRNTTNLHMKGLLMWMGRQIKDEGWSFAEFATVFNRAPVGEPIIMRTLFKQYDDAKFRIVAKMLSVSLLARLNFRSATRTAWLVSAGCLIFMPIGVAAWQLQVISMMIDKLPPQAKKKLLTGLTGEIYEFNHTIYNKLPGAHAALYLVIGVVMAFLVYSAYRVLISKAHPKVPVLGTVAVQVFAHRILGDYNCAAAATVSDSERARIVSLAAPRNWEVECAKRVQKACASQVPFGATFLANYGHLGERAEVMKQSLDSLSVKLAADEGIDAIRTVETKYANAFKSYSGQVLRIRNIVLIGTICILFYNLSSIYEILGAATS